MTVFVFHIILICVMIYVKNTNHQMTTVTDEGER